MLKRFLKKNWIGHIMVDIIMKTIIVILHLDCKRKLATGVHQKIGIIRLRLSAPNNSVPDGTVVPFHLTHLTLDRKRSTKVKVPVAHRISPCFPDPINGIPAIFNLQLCIIGFHRPFVPIVLKVVEKDDLAHRVWNDNPLSITDKRTGARKNQQDEDDVYFQWANLQFHLKPHSCDASDKK